MKTPRASSSGRIPAAPPHLSIDSQWSWHYRTLLALRDHLTGGTGDRERELSDAMEPPSLHPEDLADERYDRGLARALPQDRAVALREVEDAIQRIRTGIYGRCAATGRVIPEAQLRATPWLRCLPRARTSVHRRSSSSRS